jgi:ABC-2 type transport system ATP-binding protein
VAVIHVKLLGAGVDYPILKPRANAGRGVTELVGGTIFEMQNRTFVRALDKVNISLEKGARLGLIGNNGSGKSTLLRTLAGILPLSRGTRTHSGRILTLFSSNAGIDARMTGIENISRLAALYNVDRKRIAELTEDVANFTELGAFLDLPMSSYSAGMRARLGFGFLTALEADILLIDEVIGAGDRRFHAKAKERLEKFAASGGILVVASHSTAVLSTLCTRAIVMRKGRIVFRGSVPKAAAFFAGNNPPVPDDNASDEQSAA